MAATKKSILAVSYKKSSYLVVAASHPQYSSSTLMNKFLGNSQTNWDQWDRS